MLDLDVYKVFSDGLTAPRIVELHIEFGERVNGIQTVKLSDNPGKHMGDEDDIAVAYRVYRYVRGEFVLPVV